MTEACVGRIKQSQNTENFGVRRRAIYVKRVSHTCLGHVTAAISCKIETRMKRTLECIKRAPNAFKAFSMHMLRAWILFETYDTGPRHAELIEKKNKHV